jgi:KTSC domain-containing protein
MGKISVTSSTIRSIAYDEASGILQVEFHAGSTYEYSGVPSEVHQRLMQARSKGSYFDAFVKKAGYACRRIS